jgi:hypothetical protein
MSPAISISFSLSVVIDQSLSDSGVASPSYTLSASESVSIDPGAR